MALVKETAVMSNGSKRPVSCLYELDGFFNAQFTDILTQCAVEIAGKGLRNGNWMNLHQASKFFQPDIVIPPVVQNIP